MSPASQTRTLQRTACAVVLGAILVATTACGVRVGPAYSVGYYDDYPPDTYIATTEPVYFEGRATYWYGNRWYYRDGSRWGRYDREPPVLYQRRMQAPPVRRTYEPSRGRPERHEEHSRGGPRGHR
jgi:hypothetical protein